MKKIKQYLVVKTGLLAVVATFIPQQSSAQQSACNWYGTTYPLCVTTASGWGWEDNKSCISRSTCSGQPAPYGIVGGPVSSSSSSVGNNCPATAVTPHLKAGTNPWQQTGSATISSGTNVVLGPHPTNQGAWSWSGCGTSGTAREQTIAPTSSCQAQATFRNSCGTQTTYTYQLTVSGTPATSSSSSSSVPNVGDAINAYELGLRSNAGDQTANLDAAIQYVYSSGRSNTLYIPAGNYLISRDIRLRAGVNLIGDGIGRTVFSRNNANGYLISNARDANLNNAVISRMSFRNNDRVVLLQGVRNIKFTDVEFQGGMVRFENSSNITLDKNTFNENRGKAAYASDVVDRVTITNNRFNTYAEGAINLSRHSNSYVANNYITSPTLISSGYAGIRLPNTAYNNVVENNTIINHGRGIFILSSSHDNIVRNNTITRTSLQGMLIEASNNLIEDNTIVDAGNEAIYVNPSVAASSPTPSPANRNTITGNKISDTRAFSGSRFIGLKINGTGNQVIDNSVSSRYGRKFKEIASGNTDRGNTYE
jgi:parallel beta-helix repeat protein